MPQAASKVTTEELVTASMIKPVSLILALLMVMPLFGSGKKTWTQAENMGLAGPVKSIATLSQKFMKEPPAKGSVLVFPLYDGVYEFDREGSQTKSGFLVNGHFAGSTKHETRDAQGRVQEEWWENTMGEAMARNVYTYGPAGTKQEDSYRNGKRINSSKFEYDDAGNLLESDVYGPDGTQEWHNVHKFDSVGNEIETVSEGPDGFYSDVVRTYDPQTGSLRTFTSLHRDGTEELRLTMDDKTVLSFWQEPNGSPTYGSSVCFADNEGTERDCRDYKSDGSYARTHYVFTDKSKRNPVKATRYGTDGQVEMEANYKYELDNYGNWTQRTIWLRTGEEGERKLLERDSRTLTYYSAAAGHP